MQLVCRARTAQVAVDTRDPCQRDPLPYDINWTDAAIYEPDWKGQTDFGWRCSFWKNISYFSSRIVRTELPTKCSYLTPSLAKKWKNPLWKFIPFSLGKPWNYPKLGDPWLGLSSCIAPKKIFYYIYLKRPVNSWEEPLLFPCTSIFNLEQTKWWFGLVKGEKSYEKGSVGSSLRTCCNLHSLPSKQARRGTLASWTKCGSRSRSPNTLSSSSKKIPTIYLLLNKKKTRALRTRPQCHAMLVVCMY